MAPVSPQRPPTVRGASARLAAVSRWTPDDAEAIRRAKRDLQVAHAAARVVEAAAMLTGPEAS